MSNQREENKKKAEEEEEEAKSDIVSTISFIQDNVQHSIATSRAFTRTVVVQGIYTALIKELWYCESHIMGLNTHLVIRCKSNSHHTVRGSTNCNDRGVALLGFLNSTNLEILNQGDYPTFCSAGRLEVIDITMGSF